jgi:hypothetical protein
MPSVKSTVLSRKSKVEFFLFRLRTLDFGLKTIRQFIVDTTLVYIRNQSLLLQRNIRQQHHFGFNWVQECHFKGIENILYLAIDWEGFSGLDSKLFTVLLNNGVLQRKTKNPKSTFKSEYLLTNFLANSPKLAGYTCSIFRFQPGISHYYSILQPIL